MPAPDRKRRLTAFAVAMAVLIATPLAVVASDAFTDVPDSNVHHDDITWLADADVTKGCNPPDNTEFCPGDPVLRQQMASFMRRLAENQVVDAATALEADHATSADSATTADSANTAASAGNADMLDDIDSTDLLPGGIAPAGTTIRGTYWMGGTADADFELATSEISFGYELESAPTPHLIQQGDTAPAECPGTADAPAAAPGHLCVYESLALSAGTRNVNGPTGDGSTFSFGARLFVRSDGTGTFWSMGTWAVTAPDIASATGTESTGDGLNAGSDTD